MHCLCVVGFISSLISARMQHSDENVASLAQVIFGEKASWWTWGQLERWQAHQVGASRNMNNFAQLVQAYTVQAQACLYNTYTSKLYKYMQARLLGASYFATICCASTSTYCANNLSRKLCNTIFLSLASISTVVCSTSDSSSNGGGSGEIKSNLLQKMQSRCCHPTTGPPSSRCNTNTSSFTAEASLKI